MKLKIINKIMLYFILSIAVIYNSVSAYADDDLSFSLGAKIIASNWDGTNSSSGTEYEQTEGGQFGWNLGLQKGRFYAGLSLQGGEYNFSGDGPDQVTVLNTVKVTNVKVTRSEYDLIAGYYFWDSISFFLDIKSVVNEHDKNNYEQKFTGIGIGISGSWPINDDVSLYGSFGFLTSADVLANDKKVGSVDSSALEFGAVFRVANSHRLNVGLKAQGQEYSFNNGSTQRHNVSGLFFGYNYLFGMN
jgi:hypothetical protein